VQARKCLHSNPVSGTQPAQLAKGTVLRATGILVADELGVSWLDRVDVSCLDFLFPPVWCEVRFVRATQGGWNEEKGPRLIGKRRSRFWVPLRELPVVVLTTVTLIIGRN